MISTTNSRRCNSIPDAESLYTRICTVCKLFLQIMQNIFKRGRTVRIRRRMFIECSFVPEQLRVFLQCGKQQQPESAAEHNFADENGEREQRNRLRHFRYFCDNKHLHYRPSRPHRGLQSAAAEQAMHQGACRPAEYGRCFPRVSEEQKFRLRR